VGGAKNIKIIWLPPSLLGEVVGGRGKLTAKGMIKVNLDLRRFFSGIFSYLL
jgi:hypothetical protein